MSLPEELQKELTALVSEIAEEPRDPRKRKIDGIRGLLEEYGIKIPDPFPEPQFTYSNGHVDGVAPDLDGFTVPDGYKIVPLTKEEKMRQEVTKFLTGKTEVHRSEIHGHLIKEGIMKEGESISALAVYLGRWPEFQSDGRGNFALYESARDAA
jgi:hypothetical protein